jgi:hypothetical protein
LSEDLLEVALKEVLLGSDFTNIFGLERAEPLQLPHKQI